MDDASDNALAGHIRQFRVQQLRRVSVTNAAQAFSQPLFNQTAGVLEQAVDGLFTRFGQLAHQLGGQLKIQRGWANFFQVTDVQLDGFTDNACLFNQ